MDRERFNIRVHDELATLPSNCAAAEIAGFFAAARASCVGDDICLSTARLMPARRMMMLLKGLNEERFDATIEAAGAARSFFADKEIRSDKKRRRALMILSAEEAREIARHSAAMSICCPAEWMRGVWSSAGAIYLPQNGYHMYVRAPYGCDTAERMADIMRGVGIAPTIRDNKGAVELYLRDQQGIVSFLNHIGAVRSALELEETAIVRSLKNRANKLVNCDTANIDKTVAAAEAQADLVRRIDEEGLWGVMPPLLIEIAELRRSHPSASLRELGQMTKKQISKSTVEYRWRKLEKIVTQKGMVSDVLGKS